MDEPNEQSPLDELRAILADPYTDDDDGVAAPTFWPGIPAADAAVEWDALAAWVRALQERFGHLDHHIVPQCWWRHNQHVEALAALRDHERSSFATSSPATAPVDWVRALRDIAALLKSWTAETGCGASHQEPPVALRPIDLSVWGRHVAADVERRENQEIERAAAAGDE